MIMSSLRALAGVSEKSLELLIKSWRGAGMSDEEVVRKLREQFMEQPSLGDAISKALAAPTAQVATDVRRAVEKSNTAMPNSVLGAVAGAFRRAGFAVEKGFDGPTHEERIEKAKKHLAVSHAPGSRESIEALATQLGTRNK